MEIAVSITYLLEEPIICFLGYPFPSVCCTAFFVYVKSPTYKVQKEFFSPRESTAPIKESQTIFPHYSSIFYSYIPIVTDLIVHNRCYCTCIRSVEQSEQAAGAKMEKTCCSNVQYEKNNVLHRHVNIFHEHVQHETTTLTNYFEG